MRKALSIIFAVLLGISATAQSTLRNKVRELSSKEPLKSSVWGVLAVRLNGDTLVSYNPAQRMVPASNVKLLTTGAALKSLGADYRFHTAIAYSGEIRDSTLKGDIYIIGGGDPTLGSADNISLAADRLFARWLGILQDAGIQHIEGSVIGDGRRMAEPGHPATWQSDDLGWYYGAGVEGLNFYENEQDFYSTPGIETGAAVDISPIYPDTPWMRYTNECTTSEAGKGDRISYANSDFAPVGLFRGTLATDKGKRKQECSNRFPAMTCAYYFHRFLNGRGIVSEGGWADIDRDGLVRKDPAIVEGRTAAICQDSLTVIGSTSSPELSTIVRECLHRSDNFYAEALLRAMGQELSDCASYDSSLVAQARVLKGLGVCPDGKAQIVDGSGLSRQNYVSPAYFVDFLRAMATGDEGLQFLRSLPQPGQGTLEFRLTRSPEELKKRIWMKSGSMNGVRCFSGYILPENGMTENAIAFSVMTNCTVARPSQINPVLDSLIALIARQ